MALITYATFHSFNHEPVDLRSAVKSIATSFFPLLATMLLFQSIITLPIFLVLAVLAIRRGDEARGGQKEAEAKAAEGEAEAAAISALLEFGGGSVGYVGCQSNDLRRAAASCKVVEPEHAGDASGPVVELELDEPLCLSPLRPLAYTTVILELGGGGSLLGGDFSLNRKP